MTGLTDGHLHSEFSWDAPGGSMAGNCARAIELGLSAIVVTDHDDVAPWVVEPGELDPFPHVARYVVDGAVAPPPLDLDTQLIEVDRCRSAFPALRVLSGVELDSPHRRPGIRRPPVDRVLGSMHSLATAAGNVEPGGLYRRWPAGRVVRECLAETRRMVLQSDAFDVLAHPDYAVRSWPDDAEPFDPLDFEQDFRAVFAALAASGRPLELNARGRPLPMLARWWQEEGGREVTFGSDAHTPARVGEGVERVAAEARAAGFTPGPAPHDPWRRA